MLKNGLIGYPENHPKNNTVRLSHEVTDITSASSLVLQERLRQASLSFNLAYAATVIFVTMGFTSILLFYGGNITAGKFTTTSGFVSGTIGACWIRLAKDANDRLDKIFKSSNEDHTSSTP